MPCEAINNYLAFESGRLGPWFYKRKLFARSPIVSMVKRAEYPREMGYDFRQLTYQRAVPTSNLSWTQANAFSASGEDTDCGACATDFNLVDVGYTTRTVNLYKYEVKSRPFCVEDFKAAWEVRQQLEAIREQLGEWVARAWEQRYRTDIFMSTRYKVVANGGMSGNFSSSTATSYPAACATDILQHGMLDYWYYRLIRDGAGDRTLVPGGEPILRLIISPETSRALMVQDTNVREDIRYGNPGSLLTQLGSKIFRGFAHVIDPFPRRFTCTGGVYTEVLPFEAVAGDVLTGGELRAAYLNAPYEESTIFDPELFTSLVPRPISRPGAGQEFDPVSYTGEYIWANIPDHTGINVFRSMGKWYGRMWEAPLLVRPELGVSFIHRRCHSEMAAIPTDCVYS